MRWTFLFLHEPAWENPSESFKAIQQLLKDRKHTFFAGHLHYYDYDKIDGYEHITMGPAGASFHHGRPRQRGSHHVGDHDRGRPARSATSR